MSSRHKRRTTGTWPTSTRPGDVSRLHKSRFPCWEEMQLQSAISFTPKISIGDVVYVNRAVYGIVPSVTKYIWFMGLITRNTICVAIWIQYLLAPPPEQFTEWQFLSMQTPGKFKSAKTEVYTLVCTFHTVLAFEGNFVLTTKIYIGEWDKLGYLPLFGPTVSYRPRLNGETCFR